MKQKQSLILSVILWLAAAAVALPLILLALWSFANRWPKPLLIPDVFTLRGWERLFGGYFNAWQVVLSSIGLSLLVGVLATLLAAMAARAICLYDFPGKHLLSSAAFLPVIVPAAVFGMGSHVLLIRLGISHTAAAVILGHLVITLPFAFRTMLETTRLASTRLEEQARVLGASPWSAFVYGTLPSIAPGLISSLALSFLFSYTHYFLTLILGGGKVRTLAILVMPLIEGSDRTISSAYSILFITSTMGVFLILQHLAGRVARSVGKQLGGTP